MQVTRLKAEVVASHVNNENELSQMVRLMEVSQTETAHLRARLTASELARCAPKALAGTALAAGEPSASSMAVPGSVTKPCCGVPVQACLHAKSE